MTQPLSMRLLISGWLYSPAWLFTSSLCNLPEASSVPGATAGEQHGWGGRPCAEGDRVPGPHRPRYQGPTDQGTRALALSPGHTLQLPQQPPSSPHPKVPHPHVAQPPSSPPPRRLIPAPPGGVPLLAEHNQAQFPVRNVVMECLPAPGERLPDVKVRDTVAVRATPAMFLVP